jgi:crotonobetainyl-CoA:carnitine CoA-transferase CaiB-like acyl-CoA transferase
VTLDLATDAGAKRFRELARSCDIVISGCGLSELRKLGLTYEKLSAVNPRLIFTSVLPYGMVKSFEGVKAYDINVSAFSGISMVLGEQNREPLNFPYCTLVAGASAAGAAMAAVLAREDDGKGKLVDVSEIEVMSDLVYDISIGTAWGLGKPFTRAGHRAVQYHYAWTMLPVKDGYITITFLGPNAKEWWNTFLEVIGSPAWAKEERYQNLDAMAGYSKEVDELLSDALSGFTKDEIFALCRARGLPVVPVRDPKEAIKDPHYRENRHFIQDVFRGDLGTMTLPGLPFETGEPDSPWKAAPLLGEHNREILGEPLDDREQLSLDGGNKA